MLQMLNLIILHVQLQVQIILHKPNFGMCTCKQTCSSTRTRRRRRSNSHQITDTVIDIMIFCSAYGRSSRQKKECALSFFQLPKKV